MGLVPLGKVGKPHGFQGAFVALTDAGRDSAFAFVTKLHVGTSQETTVSFSVAEASWMPRGWKIKLAGIESDVEAKKLSGQDLYAERVELPEPSENEYYIGDLEGATIVDAATGESVGTFVGVEASGGGAPDRWWIEVSGELMAVPATKRFIEHVDGQMRIIRMKNLSELL